ncbi:MAG: ABC transporter substrate-binding protein [Alphaproteobacteria bacterium]|nr:ABC transporter substrate-binding protein [Alphaproteobacteria bacterium]
MPLHRKFFLVPFSAAALALGLAGAGVDSASARTLNWARAGDSLTLDPHAQNEGPTHALAHQIYEPLLLRDTAGEVIPALATSWGPTDDPTIWEFKLRKGVTFHNGNPFTADDVVFSFDRARHANSDMKGLLTSVGKVSKVDDHTVHIQTFAAGGHGGDDAVGEPAANPLLPVNLTNLFIMDKEWAEANNAQVPQNFADSERTFSSNNTNGTGAYVLVSREADVKTVLKSNPDYWGIGEYPLEVTEIVYTPIKSAPTRVAALLSGEAHFIQDVPVQDLRRVGAADGLRIETGPQNRVIFFGMNQGKADLATDNVQGKNPFADRRVRQAVLMTIDREAIKRVVMRNQSIPAGVIAPPFVNGWTHRLDRFPSPDNAKAKQLLSDAGYPNGFEITLNCPNDRYINDEAICQAAVGMLARIGITVSLDSRPKAQHFPLIGKLESEFYMLGWGVPTFDSEYVFNFLVHTKGEKFGTWNGTGYSNAAVDRLIEGLATETNITKRDANIAKIWAQVQRDILYVPIHHQVLNWGMDDSIIFPVQPEDQPHFKFMRFSN